MAYSRILIARELVIKARHDAGSSLFREFVITGGYSNYHKRNVVTTYPY